MTYVEINDWAAEDQVLSQKLNQMVENLTTIHHRFSMSDYMQWYDNGLYTDSDDLNHLALEAEISINGGEFDDCGEDWRFKHNDNDAGPGEYDSLLSINVDSPWPVYDISALNDGDEITMRLMLRCWEDEPSDWGTWPDSGGDLTRSHYFTLYKNSIIDTIEYQFRFTIANQHPNHPWSFRSYMKFFNSEVE